MQNFNKNIWYLTFIINELIDVKIENILVFTNKAIVI
jgi:hypothetical protein